MWFWKSSSPPAFAKHTKRNYDRLPKYPFLLSIAFVFEGREEIRKRIKKKNWGGRKKNAENKSEYISFHQMHSPFLN